MIYKIVQSISDLPNLNGLKTLLFDTETSGLALHHGDRICGLCIADFNTTGEYFYIPIRHADAATKQHKNLNPDQVFSWLKTYLDNPEITWVGHNIKFDMTALRKENLELAGRVFDTMVAAHVVDGDLFSYKLDDVSKHFLGFKHEYSEKLESWFTQNQKTPMTPEGRVSRNYSQVPIEVLAPYGCEDIHATGELARILRAQVQDVKTERFPGHLVHSQLDLLRHEMELVKVLFEMEYSGVKVDLDKCAELHAKTEDEIGMYRDRMFRLAGRSFSSAAYTDTSRAFEQAGGRVLFWSAKEKGKQKADQFTEDKNLSTGRPCWNSMAVLRYLEIFKQENNESAYRFVSCLREADQRARLSGTYLETYFQKTDSKGYIHTGFHQHGTMTGRLSSSGPNLQNITRIKGTLDQKLFEKALGENFSEALNRKLRDLFVCESGETFLSIDYSQIEYRAAAYLTGDPELIKLYAENPDLDYHEITAQAAGIDRDPAKTVNFGTLYGMGPKSLASLLNISYEAAKDLLNRVFGARPALKALINSVTREVQEKGFVQNPYGRICRVPDGFAYKGLNYLDQGFVGDMMRRALVRLDKLIRENRYPVKMRLTVHDEVCFTGPKKELFLLAPELARSMCICPEMCTIPVLCDIEAGPNWGHGLKSIKAA